MENETAFEVLGKIYRGAMSNSTIYRDEKGEFIIADRSEDGHTYRVYLNKKGSSNVK